MREMIFKISADLFSKIPIYRDNF